MSMNYLVANWKSNKSLSEVKSWFHNLKLPSFDTKSLQLIVCPPTPYLLDVADIIHASKLPLKLGIQDISPFPFGSYTGATAADMISDWVDFAIVGHSERRRYFLESNRVVANKVSESLSAGITPIVCVDEPYLDSQIHAISKSQRKEIIVAYEPLAAIGSGSPDTPAHADQVGETTKSLIDNKTPVLYGGSVDYQNINNYLDLTHINGVLVGGASLDPEKFTAMVNALTAKP